MLGRQWVSYIFSFRNQQYQYTRYIILELGLINKFDPHN